MATADTATDGSVENDNYIMNDSGCCVFVPTPESPIEERDIVCGEVCVSVPTNDCGLEHPEGSGTLAGCKSTTLPHFGVVINKRNGICRQFGYYTSGNTEEYEDECGVIVGLTSVTTPVACASETVYGIDPCLPCDEVAASIADLTTRITANEELDATQATAIADNVDNTVESFTVVGDAVVGVLEDGTTVDLAEGSGEVVSQADIDAFEATLV